jgi:hypothetical protein
MDQNAVLSALVQRHPELTTRIVSAEFFSGTVIARPEESIEQLVFPASGMLAAAVAVGDKYVDVGMVGSTGLIGGGAAFGSRSHASFILGRFPGRICFLPAELLADVANEDQIARAALFASEQWLLVQAQRIAACNAAHSVIQRLSSWLLRAADTSGFDELPAKQETIAESLGVQRASVSVAAAELQNAGCISYRRGRLAITSREELALHACDCHAELRRGRKSLER